MKIAVIGANGQLGSDICEVFRNKKEEVVELNHDRIEISDINSVSVCLKEVRPEFIVNTAAFHNVEKCEQDPASAFAINGTGARNLAMVANEINAVLLQISTDYVFDGTKPSPYVETDLPLPLNVYANTKLAGEYFVAAIAKRFFILRTCGLYGKHPCRGKATLNFVELMLKLAKEKPELKVVTDEVLTPTSTLEVARQIDHMHKSDHYGLYHATAEGQCSWYEFAKEIFTISGLKPNLKMAQPGEFPQKTPRPKFSVLENKRLKQHNLNIFRPWQEGLREYLSGTSGKR